MPSYTLEDDSAYPPSPPVLSEFVLHSTQTCGCAKVISYVAGELTVILYNLDIVKDMNRTYASSLIDVCCYEERDCTFMKIDYSRRIQCESSIFALKSTCERVDEDIMRCKI